MAANSTPTTRGDTRPLRVGIAGLGTVGAGVVKLLAETAEILRLHCPRAIEVVAVSARDKAKDRGINLKTFTGPPIRWRSPTIPMSTWWRR